ncbi:hypothetical protein ZIOFF_002214 [Zingiber officinale]|uniref:Uncharacterized protein n=1 Tax=Zingiber officinale TaxID=94328 RepID=A0A8J5HZK3_ZINOF|nr:hypothetical protein ZIOFF_002214 [Zingiber officinale]
MREVAAFLGHVGIHTSLCMYKKSRTIGWIWCCNNHELRPSQDYCSPNYLYPCAPAGSFILWTRCSTYLLELQLWTYGGALGRILQSFASTSILICNCSSCSLYLHVNVC